MFPYKEKSLNQNDFYCYKLIKKLVRLMMQLTNFCMNNQHNLT